MQFWSIALIQLLEIMFHLIIPVPTPCSHSNTFNSNSTILNIYIYLMFCVVFDVSMFNIPFVQ